MLKQGKKLGYHTYLRLNSELKIRRILHFFMRQNGRLESLIKFITSHSPLRCHPNSLLFSSSVPLFLGQRVPPQPAPYAMPRRCRELR